MRLLNLSRKRFASAGKWKPNIPQCQIFVDVNSFRSPHPIWNLEEVQKFELIPVPPKTIRDKIAFRLNRFFQGSLDVFSGFKKRPISEDNYLRRIVYMETFSAVPGMIGGMIRHFAALRKVREDGGWIHNLLEEAENSRLHLFTVVSISHLPLIQRLFILFSQSIFIPYYMLLYIISPTVAHRYVAYMNEEAVKIYTNIINDIDQGKLPEWKNRNVGKLEAQYWGLKKDAKIKDIFSSIRGDKIFIREFNHHFADIPKNYPIDKHQVTATLETVEKIEVGKEEPKKKNN